jgi:hypothetical protein
VRRLSEFNLSLSFLLLGFGQYHVTDGVFVSGN